MKDFRSETFEYQDSDPTLSFSILVTFMHSSTVSLFLKHLRFVTASIISWMQKCQHLMNTIWLKYNEWSINYLWKQIFSCKYTIKIRRCNLFIRPGALFHSSFIIVNDIRESSFTFLKLSCYSWVIILMCLLAWESLKHHSLKSSDLLEDLLINVWKSVKS